MKELGIKDEEKKQYREEYLAQERKHLRHLLIFISYINLLKLINFQLKQS